MAIETRWATVGGSAFEALAEVVDTAKAGDPLQPVTVVTPSPAAAVRLRRELARRSGGIAVVGFLALDALAEQVAAPRLGLGSVVVGVDREVVVAAIRTELSTTPGRFRGIEHHRSTWETLARTVAEVAAADATQRAAIARSGELAAEVVRVHDAIATGVGTGGRIDVLRAAVAQIEAHPHSLHQLGPVVIHLPGRLDRPAAEFVRALGQRTSVTLIGGLCGVDVADAMVRDRIVALGGTPPPAGAAPVAAAPTRVISTNDIDDEVRAAVRSLLAHAETGAPLHTMALVHPAGAPYARSVTEVLRTTGIPFSGPSTETLGHTAPGRVVLGILDVATHRFARQTVVDLWSSGVVVGADGRLVRSVALDHRSRRLGVIGGRHDWRNRVAARRLWLERNPVAGDRSPDEMSDALERRAREVAELGEIDAALTTLEGLLDRLPTTWHEAAGWVGEVLETLCGPVVRRTGWPTHEIEADNAIRTAVGRLDALAAVEPDPRPGVVVDTIRAVLEGPAPRRSGTGAGILVTTIDQPPVVPLSAVAVVGLAEGHIPRVGRDDVLLSDDIRRAAGLPVADDVTLDQRVALATALASGETERILTYARCDQRSGRRQVPSRWLVDAIETATGTRPRTEPLITGVPIEGVDLLEIVESHGASIVRVAAGGAVALHADEHRIAALAGASFDEHPASLDPITCAGASLSRHRAADAFTRFDGNLAGDGVDVLADGNRHLSPTGIETYATCPRKWFFRQALGIGDVDRPEEVERLQARDKGTIAHTILERFIGEAIEAGTVPAPDQRWGAAGAARLTEIAAEEFADFERQGLTGHPRWWAFDRDEIVSVLLQTLVDDDRLRHANDATPVAVELTFGRSGADPVRVRLDDGREVPLAGQADRVDTVPGGVRVYDYKYASSTMYKPINKDIADGGDPLDGGRRLQLLAYAEAAAQQRGVDRTSAWYWFLKPGHTGTQVGYEIGPEHRQLFREALRILVDGVGAGLYPANAGPDDYFTGTNKNCGYCEFDSICPADREEEWERVRADPALAEVVRLAEEGAPAFLVTAAAGDAPGGPTNGDTP